jgi:hypothetical protein
MVKLLFFLVIVLASCITVKFQPLPVVLKWGGLSDLTAPDAGTP